MYPAIREKFWREHRAWAHMCQQERRANRDRKAAAPGSEEEKAASARANEAERWVKFLRGRAAQAKRRLDECRAWRATLPRETAQYTRRALHPERVPVQPKKATPVCIAAPRRAACQSHGERRTARASAPQGRRAEARATTTQAENHPDLSPAERVSLGTSPAAWPPL